MAPRSYRPEDLVELPVLDAEGALALSKQLLTAAAEAEKAAPLPESVSEARSAMQTGRTALEQVLVRWPVTPPTVRVADADEDNAVGAIIDWLRSFLRLPEGTPVREQAEAVLDAFLGEDDLSFLRSKPEKEWAEVEARLNNVRNAGLLGEIQKLGGQAFLDHLQSAHAAYGVAVGVTAPKPGTVPPQVQERLRELGRLVRVYVVRVSASISTSDAASGARAEALLRPLETWESRPRRRQKKEPEPVPQG